LSLAITNAHLDVKVVADILQDGVDGYHSDTFLVKRNSGIEKPEDLKGKRIGTNAIGSASDTGMRVLLMNKGLLDKRDFTSVEVAFANMPAMLEEGKVDMGIVVQPFSDQLLKTGKYKVLYDVKDSVGPSQLVFLAARADFLKANRAALEDFFEDHVRAARWFMDPKNKDEARAIIGKFIHQSPETLDYIFTKSDYYRDPYMIPNVANIQSMVDASVKAGALPTQITVAPSHVDLSFIEGAKTRIESDKSTP
jgi:NitT/TauT family transport system substrate-binding protein